MRANRVARLRTLTLILTERCNLHCSYCLIRSPTRRDGTWPRWQATLERLLPAADEGDLDVLFTGGEPLLAFSLLRRVVARLEAAEPQVRLGIFTNGLRLEDEALDYLEAHAFDLHLSFDATPQAQARRGSGTFDVLDRLLDRVRHSRPTLFDRLRVCATVSPETVPSLANGVEYLVRKKVPTIVLSPALPGRGWQARQLEELQAQFTRIAAMSRSVLERSGAIPLQLFRSTAGHSRKARVRRWTCGGPQTHALAVDPAGRVFGCPMAADTYQPQTAPVLKAAVDALTVGPSDCPDLAERLAAMPERARACGAFTHPEDRYSSYRRCRDCEFLDRCYACPLAGASDPTWDDVRRVPDFVCAWNQVTLAHRDRFACLGPSFGP